MRRISLALVTVAVALVAYGMHVSAYADDSAVTTLTSGSGRIATS